MSLKRIIKLCYIIVLSLIIIGVISRTLDKNKEILLKQGSSNTYLKEVSGQVIVERVIREYLLLHDIEDFNTLRYDMEVSQGLKDILVGKVFSYDDVSDITNIDINEVKFTTTNNEVCKYIAFLSVTRGDIVSSTTIIVEVKNFIVTDLYFLGGD